MVFLTGFPGFLGSALVERILDREPAGTAVVCLVQEKFKALAKQRVAEIEQGHPHRVGRIRLMGGDISRPDLGLGSAYALLQQETIEIYHLAAVYALGVDRELAWRVNVTGTREMLHFAAGCRRLARLHCVSTCYVSGRYPGEYTEDNLSVSQTFNNNYDETKYLAELSVQQAMAGGLPATIYRPAVVVGDSQTGATPKYDGPYNIIQWILRQPKVAVVTVPGDPARTEINVVPRDYVVEGIAYLSGRQETIGKVYQLCDHRPLTIQEMVGVISEASGLKIVLLPLSLGLIKGALNLPPIRTWTRIEPENLNYFNMQTRYRCPQTLRALEGSGIQCPPFTDYVDKMVAFMRQYPNVSTAAMV
jgi:thioester reductase-like protein